MQIVYMLICETFLVVQKLAKLSVILDWPLVEHDAAARVYTRRTYLLAKVCNLKPKNFALNY